MHICSFTLRPSPKHGTLWLHNDDDDICLIMCVYLCAL